MPATWGLPEQAGFPWRLLVVVLIVTGAVFAPMLGHDFVNWRDPDTVVDNPTLRGPDWRAIFTEPVAGTFQPLALASFAITYQVAGLAPFGYLLGNWALHLLATALVYRLAWSLSARQAWVATFTALVFALHPMHVEAVVWVSERGTLLGACFSVLALLGWWRYLERRRARDYGLTLACFLLAVLSRPTAIVLPLALPLLAWWKQRPGERRPWLAMLPVAALSLVLALVTVWLASGTELASAGEASLGDRARWSCWVLLAYLVRFVVPWPLAAFPGYSAPAHVGWGLVLAPFALAILASGIWLLRRERSLVFGTLFFTLHLLPAMPLFVAREPLLAERFAYLPSVGLAFALGTLLAERLPAMRSTAPRWNLLVGVTTVLVVLALPRITVWRDTETLWTKVIQTYPEAALPRTYLARHWHRQAQAASDPARVRMLLERAVAECDAALRADPGRLEALDVRSAAHLRLDRLDAALTDAAAMVAAAPQDPRGFLARATVLARLARYDEALADYDRVLALAPRAARAWYGRGIALFNGKQQYHEAIESFDRALALAADGPTYLARSRTHLVLGRRRDALRDARAAAERGIAIPADYWALLTGPVTPTTLRQAAEPLPLVD